MRPVFHSSCPFMLPSLSHFLRHELLCVNHTRSPTCKNPSNLTKRTLVRFDCTYHGIIFGSLPSPVIYKSCWNSTYVKVSSNNGWIRDYQTSPLSLHNLPWNPLFLRDGVRLGETYINWPWSSSNAKRQLLHKLRHDSRTPPWPLNTNGWWAHVSSRSTLACKLWNESHGEERVEGPEMEGSNSNIVPTKGMLNNSFINSALLQRD